MDRGYCFEQVEQVFEIFPRDQVRVIKFEEFSEDNGRQRSTRCLGFSALSLCGNDKEPRAESDPYERKNAPEERRYHHSLYEEDASQLEKLLGRGLLRLEGRVMQARALARSTSSVDCCAAKKRQRESAACLPINNLTQAFLRPLPVNPVSEQP